MSSEILKLVFKSVRHYRKAFLYQVIIIALLSAVISGSLLTGWSVRASLGKTSSERLGNTGLVISSGSRYFSPQLVERLRDSSGIGCTGLLELNGFCQNLASQKESKKIHIYGVAENFFSFHGQDSIVLAPGEAAINEKLAASLDLKKGDELIVRFKEISDIPADAPFAPAGGEARSVVLKVSRILGAQQNGNFSLSINQIIPENIFVRPADIFTDPAREARMNRLLVDRNHSLPVASGQDLLRRHIRLNDMGINIIRIPRAGCFELRSERIFLESSLIGEIQNSIPSASPLLTYLGNKFEHGSKATPYSFVAALPASLYPSVPSGRNMIVNSWLANDLNIEYGDSLRMSWYAPDSLNRLIVKSATFRVSRIVEMEGPWADSLLMPDFPGISGSETCSGWDAGVPVKMKEIRQKDEDYWKNYRGTPKAFISYDTGVEIWGSNFGRATALRFPPESSESEIYNKLRGTIDPFKNGFTITDIYKDSLKAASESVDFSSLFLSLGFFLILASVVLLSFAVSSYLDAKSAEIRTYLALGFRSRWIERVMMTESGVAAFAGSLTGSFTGALVCMIIISLLNSVWSGAVQTSTLQAYFSLGSVMTALAISFAVAWLFQFIRIRRFLRNHSKKRMEQVPLLSRRRNLLLLTIAALASIALFIFSLLSSEHETNLCFASGTLLLVVMILLLRQYLANFHGRSASGKSSQLNPSVLYYSFYPSHALMPVLFIAAGIFAVFITGANRMSGAKGENRPSGGTGGFILWVESSIPLMEDLSTSKGILSLSLNEEPLAGLKFVQMKRYSGDDASCLNLNHVSVPPLLGVDPREFLRKGSFSFAGSMHRETISVPWEFLQLPPEGNTIYGIADQTVLEWGLRVRTGDTLVMRAENGQRLNIILAAGLKSSVFQGYVVIGMENFRKYFPSVSGSSVMLVDCPQAEADTIGTILGDRLQNYGANIVRSSDRLASFYEVTNTYLSVFGVFGALGMVTGIAGLGFVLLRNYNYRKKEFALLLAVGYKVHRIRKIILSEQLLILCYGVISGVLSAMLATLPSLKSSPDIPWFWLGSMIIAILITGTSVLFISLRSVTAGSLRDSLRN